MIPLRLSVRCNKSRGKRTTKREKKQKERGNQKPASKSNGKRGH